MAVDQGALAFLASVAHRIRHYLIESRQARERPRRISFVRYPRRKLHHFAKRGGERFAVGGVQRLKRNLFHADDLKSHAVAAASAPRG